LADDRTVIMCFNYNISGDVVTMDCVERIIKKDWLHPITGDGITEKDIIPLQRVTKLT
jgi:nitric oxide synthase-interacting protein